MTVTSTSRPKADMAAQVHSLIEAFNAHDLDKIMAHFTDDVVWEDPSWPAPAIGKEAARAAVASMLGAFPDLRFTARELRVFLDAAHHGAVSTWEWSGTMTGPIDPPGYAPTGKPATVRGSCRYEFKNDLIRHHVVTYDVMGLMQQVGLMPRLDSPQVKAMATTQRLYRRAVQQLHR